MGTRRIMRALKILEVSGCDRPANPACRAVIMKRADDDVSKAVRPLSDEEEAAFDAHGSGPAHDGLRARFDDQLRGRPHLTPEASFAAAWQSQRPVQRAAIRDEESGAFAARQAEEAALRRTALAGRLDKRGAAILKGDIAFSTIQALAELRREADPRLTIEKARAEVRVTHPELARRERKARHEAASA
jgi:hypothetical protein